MQKLDVRGKVCPLPLFYTKRKIEEMEANKELEIIVDDPIAIETIPSWCKTHEHEVLAVEKVENYFRIIVRKKL